MRTNQPHVHIRSQSLNVTAPLLNKQGSMPHSFRRRWYGSEDVPQSAEMVPCMSSGPILQTFSIPHIDLFSLDVGGAKRGVPHTLDLSALHRLCHSG